MADTDLSKAFHDNVHLERGGRLGNYVGNREIARIDKHRPRPSWNSVVSESTEPPRTTTTVEFVGHAAAIQADARQNGDNEAGNMKHSTLAGSVVAFWCLGFAAPLLAAQPAATGMVNRSSPSAKKVAAIKPAEKCLTDLRTFDDQMEKDGYWLGGSGYGYGYPMAGYGFIGPPMTERRTGASGTRYQNARPGYELRTLIASANILARRGQQQPCEDVLAATREIYKIYVADMHSGKVPVAAAQGWRQQQIAAAQPVTSKNTSLPVRPIDWHRRP